METVLRGMLFELMYEQVPVKVGDTNYTEYRFWSISRTNENRISMHVEVSQLEK